VSSIHDLGGMHGFGRAWTTPDGTAFYTDAERRVFRLMMGLMAGGWCDTDGFRAAVEGLPVGIYTRECFPMNYFMGMEKQLAERGLVRPGDLEAWMRGTKPASWPGTPPPVMEADEEPPLPRLFKVGDVVRLRNVNREGHTRLPGYLRGRVGTIAADRGLSSFPDTMAERTGRRLQPVYTVEFVAREVWGDRAGADDRLSAEVFQDYIETVVTG
jgi:nitrile hydratase